MKLKSAYLIVTCDPETNAIVGAAIWSSPEWEQSRQLPGVRTYVAWEVRHNSYHEAREYMVTRLQDERCRYHYLLKWLEERQ